MTVRIRATDLRHSRLLNEKDPVSISDLELILQCSLIPSYSGCYFLLPSLPVANSTLCIRIKGKTVNAHSLGLGGSTASDLLDTERVELGLHFVELLGEVILALSPELTSLDLGRLEREKSAVRIERHISKIMATYHGGRASCRMLRLSTRGLKMLRSIWDVCVVGLGLFFVRSAA